ncbi:MAG: NAD(P)/FAD-dependent oxidoreductase [bacterium]|nr:NAD(P)/FAD-dependent oxidoreductase [bacterium]
MDNTPIIIIGAGPAGLSAAHEVVKQGGRPIIFEKESQVGGISRTASYHGYFFDIGGHRFFTKSEAIQQLWHEMMHEEFLDVPRLSRIYYRGRFFNYPLRPLNALLNLGILESLLIILSYMHSQIQPYPQEDTFEQWVSNRFGIRLYNTFFKTYTEKVWGIPCSHIRSDWAAQRIKDLSLRVALSNALFSNNTAKSLIETFQYPQQGPGTMWGRFREAVETGGGQVMMNAETIEVKHDRGRILSVVYQEGEQMKEVPAHHVLSSMPISELVYKLSPPPPIHVRDAADCLTYRDFLIVVLILDSSHLFPDQWIYVHTAGVQVGRIQNFKNWSAAMVPNAHTTSIGMEYFCREGDELWQMNDADLAQLAAKELEQIGLATRHDVVDSVVLRQPKAYPVYDHRYQENLDVIRSYLNDFSNLQTIGRNGMHRYNNQDHSMLTGILAAQNVFGAQHNLWSVNEDEEYLEEDRAAKKREILPEQILIRTFARVDKWALAAATGTVAGLLILLITLLPVLTHSNSLFPYLILLKQYFWGYRISITGSFLAGGYGFLWGGFLGGLFASLRNLLLALYVYQIKKKTQMLSLRDILDHI